MSNSAFISAADRPFAKWRTHRLSHVARLSRRNNTCLTKITYVRPPPLRGCKIMLIISVSCSSTTTSYAVFRSQQNTGHRGSEGSCKFFFHDSARPSFYTLISELKRPRSNERTRNRHKVAREANSLSRANGRKHFGGKVPLLR